MANWFSARVLLAGFILLLAALLVVLVVGNIRRDSTDVVLDVIRQDSDLALKKINYTETQNGQRKWSIQADSASHDMKKRAANIENIRMVIYEQTGGDIIVSAQHGEFDLDNGLVTLYGDVVLNNVNGQSIFSDEIEFDSDRNLLLSEKNVRIVSDDMLLVGLGMQYDLNLKIFKLLSSVEASFQGGEIKLQ